MRMEILQKKKNTSAEKNITFKNKNTNNPRMINKTDGQSFEIINLKKSQLSRY